MEASLRMERAKDRGTKPHDAVRVKYVEAVRKERRKGVSALQQDRTL